MRATAMRPSGPGAAERNLSGAVDEFLDILFEGASLGTEVEQTMNLWYSSAVTNLEAFRAGDGPGLYRLGAGQAVVRRSVSMKSDEVGKLEAHALVRVVEIADLAEQRRLRGRIEHPAGWISLLDTAGGHRWAQRVSKMDSYSAADVKSRSRQHDPEAVPSQAYPHGSRWTALPREEVEAGSVSTSGDEAACAELDAYPDPFDIDFSDDEAQHEISMRSWMARQRWGWLVRDLLEPGQVRRLRNVKHMDQDDEQLVMPDVFEDPYAPCADLALDDGEVGGSQPRMDSRRYGGPDSAEYNRLPEYSRADSFMLRDPVEDEHSCVAPLCCPRGASGLGPECYVSHDLSSAPAMTFNDDAHLTNCAACCLFPGTAPADASPYRSESSPSGYFERLLLGR
eukprot:TRINITY_DN43967_c0_g1_i1.p1 TRINITY_DN43967_c0_g1~~TRINITY_DN43967_c0_g1_i1.p1  ORF type:complete len:396 (-),score=50.85 TRINITY_DN43967_c0_g1_i1:177-1364(-)